MKRRELREHIFEILFRVEFMNEKEMEEQMELFFEDLAELLYNRWIVSFYLALVMSELLFD